MFLGPVTEVEVAWQSHMKNPGFYRAADENTEALPPKTHIAFEKCWLGDFLFLLGSPILRGELLVLGRLSLEGGGELRLCYAILQDQDDHSRVLPNIVYFS